MTPTSPLHDALSQFLSQCQNIWRDLRHIQTVAWMMVGMIESEKVSLSGFGVHVKSRATYAQSHQRRFRRTVGNKRIKIAAVHHHLMKQAICQWRKERMYLSLDTTMLWNEYCLVWVGVVYRGRTVPLTWTIIKQGSSTVRLRIIQRVLKQAQGILPEGVEIVLLADRGFGDGKLMKYLRENLRWHYRIRIKSSFQFQEDGKWKKVSGVKLGKGEAYFTKAVSIGKTRPYEGVYLAFAHDQASDEHWVIVSDEITNLQTFAQYRLRFQVEESFLDLKSNGFNLESSRLRHKFAISQLCGVIALTMLFLVLQGTQVVAQGKRRWVDPHWQRGMSYLKLGWNWLRLSLTQGWAISLYRFLSSAPDPEPAFSSKKQLASSLSREFIVLQRLPAS